MKQLWQIYRVQVSVRIAEQLQYRVGLALWLIEIALIPVLAISIWSTVATTQGGSVGGYTPQTFAGYFIATMLVNYLTQTWNFWEFGGRVQQGQFSPLLLRPVHPIHADVAQNVAYKVLMLLVVIPLTVLLMLLFRPTFTLTWWSAAGLLLALALAFLMRFAVEWALALLAFWSTRVDVLNQLYASALFFLSGQAVPLRFFPQVVQIIAAILPFRWMIAFPAELCAGSLSAGEIYVGLGMQSLWLLIGLGLLLFLWRTGIRRYSAVGV
jgi:ABC-2 type transport system permease protein